jgi:sugar phosphate isomerase/epimerase
MYRNLSPELLGVIARQSELIELVLTYQFRGLDIDMDDMMKRADSGGVGEATCFLKSGGVEVGTFELPVHLGGSEPDYRIFLTKLPQLAELCTELKAQRAVVTLPSDSDQYSFQENFELFRERVSNIATEMEKHGVRIGLALKTAHDLRDSSNYEFIVKVEQMLALQQTLGQGVGVVLDVWDWFVGGGTLEGIQALTAEQIVAVRFSDLPSDVDIAKATTIDHILPSPAGQLPLDEVLAHLTQIEFDGPVSVYATSNTFKGVKKDRTIEIVRKYHLAAEAGCAYLPQEVESAAAAASAAAEGGDAEDDAESGEVKVVTEVASDEKVEGDVETTPTQA